MIPTRPPRTMSSGPQRSSFLYIILPVRLVSPNGQSWVCQQAHLSYLSYPFNYQPSLDPILQIALSSQSHLHLTRYLGTRQYGVKKEGPFEGEFTGTL